MQLKLNLFSQQFKFRMNLCKYKLIAYNKLKIAAETSKKINIRLHIVTLFGVYIIITAIFYLYPQIDIYFSKLFYSEAEGVFVFNSTMLSKLLSLTSRGITGLVLLGCMIMMFKKFLQSKSLLLGYYRNELFVFIVFVMGPVLLVQFGLKNNSHRPRPYNVVEFSGDKQFAQLSQIGRGECTHNCSFPSGHAAVGYACICFAFLPFLRRYCTQLKFFGWILGAILGLSRVAGGYHFLSDILFSGFFIYLVILLIFLLLYGAKNKSRTN